MAANFLCLEQLAQKSFHTLAQEMGWRGGNFGLYFVVFWAACIMAVNMPTGRRVLG
jgi:hypothetical protein